MWCPQHGDSAGRIASYRLGGSRWTRGLVSNGSRCIARAHTSPSPCCRTACRARSPAYIYGPLLDLAHSRRRPGRPWQADRPSKHHRPSHGDRIMQVDFGDEAGSEHSLHLAASAHYEHAASGGSPGYSPFRHPSVPGVPPIDPGLDQSTGANRNGQVPMTSVSHHQPTPNHLLQPSDAGHLSHGFYGDMARSSQTPPTSSHPSPRFAAISPTSQPKQVAASYTPDDRSPPPRDVSDDSIDNTYANFILYCNPNFPTSIDTTELVKLFRTPPKSDGNSFSTWALFELIKKFDAKEIKTWTQLALDLGVKSPDTDKGQSTQKVQQYSVRLKVRLRQLSKVMPFQHSFPALSCFENISFWSNGFMHVIRTLWRSPLRLQTAYRDRNNPTMIPTLSELLEQYYALEYAQW